MKLVSLISLVIFPTILFSQGATCADMDPICTDVGASFTANTGTTSESGNDYGCLSTQPNPSWYYFEVATNGNIDMSLTAGSDIDFIIWGPYANLAAAKADCGSLGGNEIDCSYSATNIESPSIPNAVAGQVYIMLITNYANVVQDITLVQTGGSGSTDCSIVTNPPCFMSYFEATIGVCNSATGTYEVTGSIDFDDPPSTGNLIVRDCDGNQTIVASAPFNVNAQGQGSETYTLTGLDPDGGACSVTAFFSADPTCTQELTYTAPECLCYFNFQQSYNVEPCDIATNTFDISGTLQFTNPPNTGFLEIYDCNGNIVQYPAPFTSPLNFVLPNIPNIGTTNCDLTAAFTADPGCNVVFTGTEAFDHPNCACPVDIGTFTTTVTGSSSNSIMQCFNDEITIIPNGDFIPHDDQGSSVTASYDPAIAMAVFSCPPTVGPPNSINSDPCLLGIVQDNMTAGWTETNIWGDNQTYWYVPISMYNYNTFTYAIDYSGFICYDLGNAWELTSLAPIQENTIEDCFAGTATTQIAGGTPSFNGSNFNVVPGSLTPASASFVNTSCANLGTITVTGLLDGDAYSYQVVDENDCPITISGVFNGMEDASFTYNFKYCQDEADPTANITGVPGGNFTASPGGLVFLNPTTGLIDLSASTPGTYTITYESPAATCWGTETFVLSINPLPLVNATEDSPICDDGVSTIQLDETGGEATSWSWTSNGSATITNPTDQNPIVSNDAVNGEIFTVTVTNLNTGCTNSDQVSVTVNPLEDATFTLTDYCAGAANSANITGTTGGTFAFNPAVTDGATINTSTGAISNGVGGTTYTVEYTTSGACPDVLTQDVLVKPVPTVDPVTPIGECNGDPISVTFTGSEAGANYAWTNSVTTIGLAANGNGDITTFNGVNTGTTAVVSNLTVTPSLNGCTGPAENFTITVNPTEDATFTLTDYCVGAANSANITGTTGGTFAFNPAVTDGATINPSTGEITNGVGGTTYTVEYTTSGACPDVLTQDVLVKPIPTVDPVTPIVECNGDPISVTFTGSEAGANYAWTNSVTTIGLAANGNGDITSFNGVNTGTTAVVSNLTVTPSLNGCTGPAENFTITVNPTEDATFTLTDYCVGAANSANITGTTGGTFAFNPAVTDGATINPSTGEITNGVGGTTYTVEYTTSGACPDVLTQDVLVKPIPTVDPVTPIVECNGDPISVTFTGSEAGANYAWTNSVTTIGLAANGNGDITSFNGVNTGTTAVVSNLTVTPSLNGCTGPADNFTITVNPTEDATFTLTDYCVGAANSANITGTTGGTFAFNPAVTDGATINPSTGEITNGVGGTTYTVEYTTSGACPDVLTQDVLVKPIPTVDPVTPIVECNGDPISVTFTGSEAGANYAWTNSVTTIGLAANGNGDITSFNGVNTGTTAVVSNLTVTPSLNGCTGPAENFTITVNPTEDATFTLTDYCVGAANSANITGTTGGTFAFNPAVTDGATINTSTGEITNGVGGTTYTVEYTTGGACVDVSTQTVTVNPNPVPVITGALQYCQGTSTTLSTTTTYTDYLWSTGSVNQSTSATIVDNPITVQVTDALGCVGTSTAVNVAENNAFVYNSQIEICQGESAEIHGNMETVAGVYSHTYNLPTGCDSTVNVTLVVNPLPSIDAGLDVTICNGESTVLTATGGTSYSWDNGLGAGNNFNVSPTITTTYIVTGTDANNCSNTDDIIVTVNPLPTASISGTTAVCENDASPNITITGANGTAPYTFTYNINGGADLTVNSTVGNDAIIAVPTTPSGTFTYNLVSVEDASATNCTQLQNGSATITINANPSPSIIGDVDYCEGFTASISADQVYTTYDWSTGDNTQTIDVTTANNPITLTVTNAAGCSGTSAVYNIIENPTPVIDAGQDITICDGGSTTLTATGAVDYSWDNGLGIGNNFNVSPTSNTIYTVTGTDANGCVGTDDVEVFVSAPPTATISGTTSICENDPSPNVTFTGADGTAPYTFTYNINGGPDLTVVSNGNTADVVAPNTPSGVYTFNLISVEESSANNCSQNQNGSAVITVNALPNIEAGADQVACGNDQITLSATGGINYVWDNGVQNGVPFTPVTGVYTVIGVDANGCTNTDNVSVLVSPTPVPDFTVDYTSCEPFVATLTNTTQGVSTNCVWQISNTAPIQGCGPLVLTFTSPGQYDVTLTTSNQAGCTASTTVTNAFSFEESPVAEFSPYNTVISTLDTEVHFENTSTGASSYNWDFGDNSPNSSDTNPVHEYNQDETGNYVVTLIAYSNAGCSDTAYGYIRIEEEIIYYVPNTFTPDNDGFNQTFQPVFTAGYDPFDYTLLIFDRWGEIVFESHDVTVGWDGTYGNRYDVQDGTYTWKIEFKTTINDKRISKVGHVNVLR